MAEPEQRSVQSFAPGEILLDRFQLGRRLGAGGLAEVFHARDRLSGAEVAIKALHAHLAQNAAVAERFRREMAITRRLEHPGIVRVFDLHEQEGRPFFSMELLRGGTLAERLREGPMPPAEARRIAREICAALQAAHRAGVVHRDLKPQNVFLTESGSVKLVDFGLARVAGQAGLTTISAVMGTPGYIAPELWEGERADPRADVYSLGATFFEMLTGRRAFSSSDPYAVSRSQRETLPLAGALNPLVTRSDELVLQRALAPDPELRFLDAGQMLRALEGEEVPAPPATPPPMSAGDFDVLVHHVVRPAELLRRRRPIDEVLDRLGARAPASWKLRLAGAGQAVLVSGASRRTAEAAASVCAEHGLPATVRAAATRPPSERWLARHGWWASAILGGALGAAAAWVMDKPALAAVAWAAAAAATGYLLSWGFRAGIEQAPVCGLPPFDTGMRRLAEGVARRVARLRKTGKALPPEEQQVLSELVAAADDATGLARQFSRDAAVQPAPQAEGAVPSLTPVELRSFEALTERLLEIATALDDALAVADQRTSPAAADPLKR